MTRITGRLAGNPAENGTDGLAYVNKRRTHRRRVLKAGSIILNGGCSKFDCTIRNLNEFGALLNMSDITALPDAFEFKIDNEGTTRAAVVIWKNGTSIGVQFY